MPRPATRYGGSARVRTLKRKCRMMTESQTYFSDMRPRFDPFEIDCGKIPAYRYSGGLAVGTRRPRR